MSFTTFTPWAGLAGGILIGISAVILMAGAGRIAGCSGIFRGLLTLQFNGEFLWRALFIAAVIIGAAIAGPFAANAQNLEFAGTPALIIGGLLVGFGTTLANGCTSGHGICGLARFSPRSLVAVITFMVAAFITVFLTRHVLGG